MSEVFSPDNLIAGDFPIETGEVVIASGHTLARGTVLGMNTTSQQCEAVDVTDSDGTENPYAVLAQSTDASAASVAHAPVYLTGEFNKSSLSFGGTTTAASVQAKMRDLSMFIKEAQVV